MNLFIPKYKSWATVDRVKAIGKYCILEIGHYGLFPFSIWFNYIGLFNNRKQATNYKKKYKLNNHKYSSGYMTFAVHKIG